MTYLVPINGFSWASPDTVMLFAPYGYTHHPSPRHIAVYEIMKLKVSQHICSVKSKNLCNLEIAH